MMRHFYRALCSFRVITLTLLLVTTVQYLYAQSLKVHYRFDGDLKDVTGKHDGKPIHPELAPVFAPGRVGDAIDFENPYAGIEVSNPKAIDFSRDFTIAAWVNVGTYWAELPVLFKGHPDQSAVPDKYFGLIAYDRVVISGKGQGEWGTRFQSTHRLLVNDGQWHHIAVTYTASGKPHFTIYVDGQGKTPSAADKGTFYNSPDSPSIYLAEGIDRFYEKDFVMQPDAPGSVLRIGCGAESDKNNNVRAHLGGLMDELQIYDSALTAEDILFLFKHPGSDIDSKQIANPMPQILIDPGHPWRPPFGVQRVGHLGLIVRFSGNESPLPENWLVAYRNGQEVERRILTAEGNSPFTARLSLDVSPAPDELALYSKNSVGKQVELTRWTVERSAFEADAEATADPVINLVDLGAILPPADWLVLSPKQKGRISVAAFTSKKDIPGAQATAWFESAAGKKTTAAMELRKGIRAETSLILPSPSFASDRDVVHVAIVDGNGKELWHKKIKTMLVGKPPQLPEFGATETKLRCDYPILLYSGPDKFTEIPYEQAWDPALKDVVVSLPNGSRFVFWRGAAYTPFWAGLHNTALNYEFAEDTPRPDGKDCVDASSDRELRYGRVEIIESTQARVHVRWSTQPCDLNYKVWGETVAEDFYFYPDGFGTRVITLLSEPNREYELEEILVITPPAAYPLRVLPENLADVLFYDGSKHELKFPILSQERDYEKLLSGKMPPLYRYRMSHDEIQTAIYFNPDWTRMPVMAYRPFYSQGQLVTPYYWGNHLPLTRSKPTGIGIDYHTDRTPAHNAMMSWGHRRPTPLESMLVDTVDALGISRQMQVRQWAWLIGMSDAPDGRLLEWAHSYANPPDLEVTGGQFISHVPQSRASRIEIKALKVIIGIKPSESCVNPVFELVNAPKTLLDVKLEGRQLKRDNYAWDGQTLWLNTNIDKESRLELRFGE